MASAVVSSVLWLANKLTEAIGGGTAHEGSSSSSNENRAVETDLKRLKRLLVRIQAVLHDAERREIHDLHVKLWLSELRGVAFQAEDVLDEYHYEVLRSIVESRNNIPETSNQHQRNKRKLEEVLESSLLTKGSSSFGVTKISIPDGMAEKVKDIIQEFEEIARDCDALHLRMEDGVQQFTNPQKRPPSSSHVDESEIFGRQNEKDEVIKLLLSESNSNYHVVSIVGKGGLGKTTLAQLVYNDTRVRDLFDLTAWVSVSDDFDLIRLTKATIELVTKESCAFSELNELQDILKKELKGRKLFLVLDDVWNERQSLWDSYRVVFVGASDVKILVTTRSMVVAKTMQNSRSFRLDCLPEDQSWKLFLYYAFGTWDLIEQKNLFKIGRGIVKKCNGLPLAIKTLGGFLGMESNEEKWREVLESNFWEIDEERNDIFPVLSLSYYHLPLHLRPCFLYLSIFPKDTLFDKGEVVRLWMAHGFITTMPKKLLEDLGSEYFEELQSRSLIDSSRGKHLLHDLIHDMAISISKNVGFSFKNEILSDGRYRVYHLNQFLDLVPTYPSRVRTVISMYFWFSNHIDTSFLSRMVFLRVLVLKFWVVDRMPDAWLTLKHLRYLKIENRRLTYFPDSICHLYHLQTLELITSSYLPRSINNLINLHFLSLSVKSMVQKLPMENCPVLRILTIPNEVVYLKLDLLECSYHEINFSSKSNIQRMDILGCSELITIDWMDVDLPYLQKLHLESCPILRILTIPSEIVDLELRDVAAMK